MTKANVTRQASELPYIKAGPFKIRFPFIHYKLEKVEFIQGLIVGATALSAIPYITDYLELPYELAYSMVILETSLYILHGTLGDPVVPGWITATLPLTLIYLTKYDAGPDRIRAMIALQLLVAALFIFMSITKLATRFVNLVPSGMKAGILLATPISVLQTQLGDKGGFKQYPVSLIAGFGLLIILSYSIWYKKLRAKNRFLDFIASYGNLFPYLFAMLVGVLISELPMPTFELGTILKVPDFQRILSQVSVFAVGFPKIHYFADALPLALVSYVIAFGDFVTTESLVEDARESRNDEYIDFDSNRSNLIIGIRNTILGLVAPFPPLAGPLWAGMTVSISQRYKEGKAAMDSLIGGMASFRLATFLCVLLIPITSFMRPIYSVGGAITLLFQAIVCAKIGMEYCEDETDKMIAGFMAAVLAFAGSGIGLLTGVILTLVLKDVFAKAKYDESIRS